MEEGVWEIRNDAEDEVAQNENNGNNEIAVTENLIAATGNSCTPPNHTQNDGVDSVPMQEHNSNCVYSHNGHSRQNSRGNSLKKNPGVTLSCQNLCYQIEARENCCRKESEHVILHDIR